jgi:hypothetical protein
MFYNFLLNYANEGAIVNPAITYRKSPCVQPHHHACMQCLMCDVVPPPPSTDPLGGWHRIRTDGSLYCHQSLSIVVVALDCSYSFIICTILFLWILFLCQHWSLHYHRKKWFTTMEQILHLWGQLLLIYYYIPDSVFWHKYRCSFILPVCHLQTEFIFSCYMTPYCLFPR